jgi:lipopolysaccharide export system protein LptA
MAIQVLNAAAANVVWTTDKAEINAGSADVTYQVYVLALGSAAPVGNLYANVVSVPSGTTQEIYVGAGNKLTMVGTTFTVRALGTASSAQYSVFNAAGN